MMNMLKNVKPLAEQISARVERGKSNAFSVQRDVDGELVLCAGWKQLPILDLRIQVNAGGKLHRYTHETFRGILLMDDHGAYNSEARLAIVDESGRTILSSEADNPVGRVLVVAQGKDKGEKPYLLTCSALFLMCPGDAPRSIVLCDASEEFAYYAALEWELLMMGRPNE